MIVTPTETEGLKRSFRVSIPADDMLARLERRIESTRSSLRLKGFRPGKVPASHIRRIYGRSMMEEEMRSAVGESTRKVIEDKKLRLAMTPDVHVMSDVARVVTGASDLEFALEMEVLPEMTLAPLSELKLVRYTTDMPDHEVRRTLSSLAESAAATHPASDGHALADGDVCVVSYQGRIDGQPFAGSDARDETILVGAGRYLPALERALTGKCAGESGRVEIVFPDDYGAQDLRGKQAEFSFQVTEVRLRKVPAVDDALALSLGVGTLAKLTEAVKKRLDAEKDTQSRRAMEKAALDWLDQRHRDIALPEKLVAHEYEKIRQHTPDGSETEAVQSDKSALRVLAERRVRLGLVLAEIGSQAGIEVKQSELDRAVEAELARHGSERQRVSAYLREHPEAVDRLRAPIYEGKVINYVIERAGVTTMTVSFADFQARMHGQQLGEASGGEASEDVAKGGAGR